MRQLVSRLLIVGMLLLVVAIPGVFLAQDGPTITVTPDTGAVGAAVLEVNVSGLTPETTYTVEFVLDGLVVFATDEEADEDGNIIFSAASTPDDEVGTYTVQVIRNDSIITATDFELTPPESDDTGESDTEDSNEGDTTTPTESIGNLTITPATGPISTVHTIRIRDLDPDTAYTVEITATQTESVVYRRLWTSDDIGNIDIEIFAEEGDTPGQQVVRVLDNSGNVVAQGDFTIEAPPERNVTVDVTPQVAQAGREITITVNGLASFDRVSAQITAEDNTLVDTILARASSEGMAILSFLSDDELEDGTYTITIFVDGDELAESTLTIGDAPPATDTDETDESDTTDEATPTDAPDTDTTSASDVSLTVEPELGPRGSTHVMTVTGLEAGQAITLTILNEADEVEYATTRTADDNGEFTINIQSSEEDELGNYPVEISDATTGQVLAEGNMLVTAMDATPEEDDQTTDTDETEQTTGTPSISVTPASGEIGATHTITLSGMPANERVGVTIRYASDDTLAQSSVVMIDADGNGTLDFTSRDLNTPGVYNVIAVQPDGTLAETTLTIEGAVATVEPQSGVIGSTHTITVTGLNANETVTFNVMFDGEMVYSTDATADADGVATLSLATEEGDDPGDYTVMVERESGNQPSVTLTATAEEEVTEDTGDESTDTTDDSADETSEEDTSESDETTEATDDVTQANMMGEAEVFQSEIPARGVASLTFSGDEGDYVLINVESDEFDTIAAVYNEDFLEIGYNDDVLGTTNSQIGPIQLPYTGDYSLEVSSFNVDNSAGSAFTATITPITPMDITYDEPIPFSLSEETPAAYFELTVEAGDSLNITGNTSGTLDTVMRLIDSAGLVFASDDDSGAGFEAELNNLIFDIPGTYLLELSSFNAGETGEGTLMVTRNPVKTLADGPVTVTLNDKSFRDLVVFDAFAGELVTLNLEKLSGSVEDLYVYASVDGMQVMSYTTMGVPTNLPLTFVMPMDGTVIVTLEEFGFGSGISFEVSVTKSRRD